MVIFFSFALSIFMTWLHSRSLVLFCFITIFEFFISKLVLLIKAGWDKCHHDLNYWIKVYVHVTALHELVAFENQLRMLGLKIKGQRLRDITSGPNGPTSLDLIDGILWFWSSIPIGFNLTYHYFLKFEIVIQI